MKEVRPVAARRIVFLCMLWAVPALLPGQPRTDALLADLLRSQPDETFRQVLLQPEAHRLQIVYTQINRDRHNRPAFTNYYFHYDPELYFNPASMVKMPLAFLALEKLAGLKQRGVHKYTTVVFDSNRVWQRPLYTDTTAANGKPTVAHFIKRAFLISENDPYNRLYQLLGQGLANRRLHQMGYGEVRITRQFLGLTPEQNRCTNGVRFLNAEGRTLYTQPPVCNADSFDFSRAVLVGRAHRNAKDSLVAAPFDFTRHNVLSLESLQRLLQSVLFPQAVPVQRRFRLTPDDYAFLRRYLSQYPSETADPKYDTAKFYDGYVKFFFRDGTRRMPPHIRVFNKVGWSYGFLTDVSYVADFKNNVEFMLAATLYVNSDGVVNDGRYDYESVGYPFLYQLGQTIYRYELERPRRYKPNLSAFRLPYESRDPADQRPSLSEVDN